MSIGEYWVLPTVLLHSDCLQFHFSDFFEIFPVVYLAFLCFVRKKQKQDETTTATYYDNRQRPGCGLSVPKQIIASVGEKGWTLVNGSRCYEWTGCDFVVGCGWCLKGGHLIKRCVCLLGDLVVTSSLGPSFQDICIEKVRLKGY